MSVSIVTVENKKAASAAFKSFINDSNVYILNVSEFVYGLSHDGFTVYNPHSNSFGSSEISIINSFCNRYGYSFSFYGRKWDNTSGYGSIACEVQI